MKADLRVFYWVAKKGSSTAAKSVVQKGEQMAHQMAAHSVESLDAYLAAMLEQKQAVQKASWKADQKAVTLVATQADTLVSQSAASWDASKVVMSGTQRVDSWVSQTAFRSDVQMVAQ